LKSWYSGGPEQDRLEVQAYMQEHYPTLEFSGGSKWRAAGTIFQSNLTFRPITEKKPIRRRKKPKAQGAAAEQG
jgi:hypothetical protein